MSYSEEVQVLVKTIGADGLVRLKDGFAKSKDEAQALFASLDKGEIEVEEFQKSLGKLGSQIGAQAKLLDTIEGKSKGSARGFLDLSRATQDFIAGFQSNGINGALSGVSNNLEGLATLLGGGAALATGFNLVGALAPLFISQIQNVWASLKGPEKVALEKALGDAYEAIKKLKDDIRDLDLREHDATVRSLAAVEESLKRQLDIKKEMAKNGQVERDAKAAVEGAKATQEPTAAQKGAEADDKTRAEIVNALGGPEFGALFDALVGNRTAENAPQVDEMNARIKELSEGLAALPDDAITISREWQAEIAKLQGQMTKMAADAREEAATRIGLAKRGDENAIRSILDLPGQWIELDPKAQRALQRALDAPAQQKAAKDAEARRKADEAWNRAREKPDREINDPIRKAAEEKQRQAEQKDGEKARKDEAARKKRAEYLKGRPARLARNAEEDRINATGTPEEIAQSEAMAYAEKRFGKIGLNDKEQLDLAERMVENRRRMPADAAADEALLDLLKSEPLEVDPRNATGDIIRRVVQIREARIRSQYRAREAQNAQQWGQMEMGTTSPLDYYNFGNGFGG